jgi:hypothetical protein
MGCTPAAHVLFLLCCLPCLLQANLPILLNRNKEDQPK